MVLQKVITLPPFSKGIHPITNIISNAFDSLPEEGLLNIFILHTSAALTINENTDSDVLTDLENFLDRNVPEQNNLYLHSSEGNDDMPAHIKTSFIGTSLNIPIKKGKLLLGTWQGVYLCEFRKTVRQRRIVLTVVY